MALILLALLGCGQAPRAAKPPLPTPQPEAASRKWIEPSVPILAEHGSADLKEGQEGYLVGSLDFDRISGKLLLQVLQGPEPAFGALAIENCVPLPDEGAAWWSVRQRSDSFVVIRGLVRRGRAAPEGGGEGNPPTIRAEEIYPRRQFTDLPKDPAQRKNLEIAWKALFPGARIHLGEWMPLRDALASPPGTDFVVLCNLRRYGARLHLVKGMEENAWEAQRTPVIASVPSPATDLAVLCDRRNLGTNLRFLGGGTEEDARASYARLSGLGRSLVLPGGANPWCEALVWGTPTITKSDDAAPAGVPDQDPDFWDRLDWKAAETDLGHPIPTIQVRRVSLGLPDRS